MLDYTFLGGLDYWKSKSKISKGCCFFCGDYALTSWDFFGGAVLWVFLTISYYLI